MNIKLDNLKKENISYKNKYDSLNNKYIAIVINYNSNKKELEKALKEMDTYSQLLLTLENKMNKAEIDKKKAEFERDNAIMETRNIRERYINRKQVWNGSELVILVHSGGKIVASRT